MLSQLIHIGEWRGSEDASDNTGASPWGSSLHFLDVFPRENGSRSMPSSRSTPRTPRIPSPESQGPPCSIQPAALNSFPGHHRAQSARNSDLHGSPQTHSRTAMFTLATPTQATPMARVSDAKPRPALTFALTPLAKPRRCCTEGARGVPHTVEAARALAAWCLP